jgi:hypothetical protein
MQSRNVKQEIQLAWRYERPYMPLLLEQISFPEQIEYWLEGWQWIEVLGRSPEHWLPKIMRSLARFGVIPPAPYAQRDASPTEQHESSARTSPAAASQESSNRPKQWVAAPDANPTLRKDGLARLREMASFTDRIWPLPADKTPKEREARGVFRGLGAPQDHVQHDHRIGSDVCLVIETNRDGHLLLLDEGPEGITYCLCPSWFAPAPFLPQGRHYLPQRSSRYDAFRITGSPGREHLLAIISDRPLDLDWMSADPSTPARVLSDIEIETLLSKLRSIEPGSWIALATYFDIVA